MTVMATAPAALLKDGLDLVLATVEDQTAAVRSFTLRDPDGAVLPGYVPGSHIMVECGPKANAYSLTGSGTHPSEYTISVLRIDSGDGGSAALHGLSPGDQVRVSPPRSAFAPVANARRHVLVAAGIGITPILSHARAAAEWGRNIRVLYSYRPGAAAHLEDMRRLCGNSLLEFTDRRIFRQTLDEDLASQPLGTHLYVCGPQAFMESVLKTAELAGWPAARLHSEPFGAAALDPGLPFRVRLTRSGESLEVPAGTSLLESLEAAGRKVPNMCRQGVCGECVLPVLRGVPEHRDLYLSDEEKSANDALMCCVSRSLDHELELDL
jgi:ferredoxin-NADP reductase